MRQKPDFFSKVSDWIGLHAHPREPRKPDPVTQEHIRLRKSLEQLLDQLERNRNKNHG
jgi:hypothetical protein